MTPARTARVRFIAIAALLLHGVTPAADLYWSGTNTWDTSSQIWGTASGGPYDQAIWNNATPDAAIFEGTAGTVTLGTGITAAGVTFAIDGYTLTGNTLTLSTTGTGITATGSATIDSAIALSGNQSWSVASGKTLTTGGVVSGSSTITYGGGGAYDVNAANTASGNATISAATVTVGGSGVLMASGFGFAGFRSVTLTNGGTLAGRGWAILGEIADGAGNIVFGSGGGTFRATASADLGATVNKGFTVNASQTGVFDVPTGVSASWSGSFAGRDFQVNSGGTLEFDIDGSFTTSRALQGAGAYRKAGSGTLVITGSSSYSGATAIAAGTLQYGDGGTGSVSLPGGAISGSGNLVATDQAITLGGAVSLTGSGGVSITQTNAGAFPNCINLADGSRTIAAASITVSGDVGNNDRDGGSLALDTSAANGAIDLNVSLGRPGVTYVPNSLSANAGTGVITVSGTGPGSSGWRNTPVTLTGDMNITAAVNSGAAVTLNQTNASPGVVSGVLSGGMSLTKAGAGTLAASAVNTFSGGLVVNAGTFQAAAGTSGNESAIGSQGNTITVGASGRLEFTASRGAGFHNGSVAVNGGRLSFTSSDNSLAVGNTVTLGTAAGTIDGTGMWRFRGGSTLRVLAAATGSTLSTSTVDLYDGNQTFNVDAGASLTVSAGFTADGGGVYNKAGGGTMAITAVQGGYGNTVTVNAGTLDIAVGTSGGTASGLGSGGNAVAVGVGATLLFSGGSRTAGFHTGAVTVNNGTITFNTSDNSFAAGNTVTLDVGPGTINGSGQWLRRNGNNRVNVTAAASGSVISVADLYLFDNSPAFEVANGSQANDLTISGGITGGATLTKTGVGTLAVTGANTSFAGATAINAGTLLVANASALGATGGITIGASGTLGVDAGVAFSRPLTITSGGRVNLRDGASVALPNAAALAAFESTSPFAAVTSARILSGSGSTTPAVLTSGWVAKPAGDYYSDILSLDGTGAGNTYVLSLAYDNTVTNPAGLNIWYRTGTSGPFTPLGTSFVGTTAWTNESTVGQYGVDTTAGAVWVVTDHNSQFVVVPEPGVGLLAGMGGLALVAVIARRRRSDG